MTKIEKACRKFKDANELAITPDQMAELLRAFLEEIRDTMQQLKTADPPKEYASVKELAQMTGYSKVTVAHLLAQNAKKIRTIVGSMHNKYKNNRRYSIKDFFSAVQVKL